MTAPSDLPEVRYAEYPERKCRLSVTEDGLIDHWCDLAELHPGPCCPKASHAAIARRQQWEAAHQGWEKLRVHDDPFAGVESQLGESR
jgi:hypothetical protein